MKYMLMIFDRDDAWDTATEEDDEAVMAQHIAFEQYLEGRGIHFSGEALHPPAAATTLRPDPDGGPALVTDGPSIELKEHLGGYYIIDAADLDDAIDIARHCPSPHRLEIRPIFEIPVE